MRLACTLRLENLGALETMLPRPNALFHFCAPAVTSRCDTSMLVSIITKAAHTTVLLKGFRVGQAMLPSSNAF
jgi:hypothetical protein